MFQLEKHHKWTDKATQDITYCNTCINTNRHLPVVIFQKMINCQNHAQIIFQYSVALVLIVLLWYIKFVSNLQAMTMHSPYYKSVS